MIDRNNKSSLNNAGCYKKNFHHDSGKNSLDVIGHTHIPADYAFQLSGTVEEFVGQALGPVSLCRVPFSFFFHFMEMCSSMANHLSHKAPALPLVRVVYLPKEDEMCDPKKPESFLFSFYSGVAATWEATRRGRGEEICDLSCFMSTVIC